MKVYGGIHFPKRSWFRTTVQLGLSLLLLSTITLGQKDTAPIFQEPDWKRYRLTPHKFSVVLPKMPVTDESRNDCASFTVNTYVAYADDVVYTVQVFADTRKKPPSWCEESSKFDANLMERQIAEMEAQLKLKRTQNETNGTYRKVMLSDDLNQVQFVGDPSKGGFFQFSIAQHKDRIVDSSSFFNSLGPADSKGLIEIRKGSPRTIGDREHSSLDKSSWKDIDPATIDANYRVVHKFRARYTDAARLANIQGTVRLKVTLLASGATGAITPVTKLPHGLTEQAIDAARRIVFLPKKVKGVNQSVIVTLEYGFSIY